MGLMRIVSLLAVAAVFGVPSVFYGGALGLSVPTVLITTVIGSMIGVTVNLLASSWIVATVRRRAAEKGKVSRLVRLERTAGPILERFGTIGLALAGPVLLGTCGTALVAPAFGVSRMRTFLALFAGVTFWCAVWAVAADLLVGKYGTQP